MIAWQSFKIASQNVLCRTCLQSGPTEDLKGKQNEASQGPASTMLKSQVPLSERCPHHANT
jgi:hypothetical protein